MSDEFDKKWPSGAEFRDRLVASAEAEASSRRSWRRRLVVALAVLAPIPVGIAVANQLQGGDRDPVVVEPSAELAIGYENPETNAPILCEDGQRLTRVVRGIDRPPPVEESENPTCSDGSTPEEFLRLKRLGQEFEERLEERKGPPVPIGASPGPRVVVLERR